MRSLLVFVTLLSSLPCMAEERVIVPAPPQVAQPLDRATMRKQLEGLKPEVVVKDGVKGVWFTPADAEVILGLLKTKLTLAMDTIDLQDKQIALLSSSVSLYKQSTEEYKNLGTLNQQMFNTAMQALPKLEPVADPWYKSHHLIFAIGMVAGGALVIGAAYAMGSVAQHVTVH